VLLSADLIWEIDRNNYFALSVSKALALISPIGAYSRKLVPVSVH